MAACPRVARGVLQVLSMGLFDFNVVAVGKLMASIWRDIAKEAAGLNMLDLQEATIEVKVTLRPKMKKGELPTLPRIESAARMQLYAHEVAKPRGKPADTAWKRLMGPDDLHSHPQVEGPCQKTPAGESSSHGQDEPQREGCET
jgi:hypothetical protein